MAAAGAWSGPAGTPFGDWLLYRALDALLLAVVWWALRLLPGLLTRATVPALAVGAVCAIVLGLLTSQFLRMLVDATQLRWDLYVAAGLGGGVPAALIWGLLGGAATAVTLRLAVARTGATDLSDTGNTKSATDPASSTRP